MPFERRPAARRLANLGLLLGLGGLVLLAGSAVVATTVFRSESCIYAAVATGLGAFFAALAGLAFSIVSLVLSVAYWRRAVVVPGLLAALVWLVAQVD